MGTSSLWRMRLLFPALLVATMSAPVVDSVTVTPGCMGTCGGVDIPYPFGIGSGCFRKGFEISCVNNTVPVMAGTSQDMRVLNLTLLPRPVARVMLPIVWQCFNSTGDQTGSFDGGVNMNPEGVYRISSDLNELVLLGCNSLAQVRSGVGVRYSYQYYTGCVAYANDSSGPQDGVCRGVGCCRVDIPPGLTDNVIRFTGWSHADQEFCPCDYAFIADRGNYTFRKADLLDTDMNRTTMPLSLDWAIRDNGSLSCAAAVTKPGYACISRQSDCVDSANGPGYTCNCTKGYEGNPYVVDGCTDLDECAPQARYPCMGKCKNIDGSYECTCPSGYESDDPFTLRCIPIFPMAAKISIGLIGGILLIAVMSFSILNIKKKKKKYDTYKRNGGPLLEKARIVKIFKKVDLEPILKKDNLIGNGGFGEVYKGHLGKELVAVKKPIIGNAQATKQFPNEVIIQTQIIHKNIVRLIGCCLEVDSPMLVYEYIPNGSMDDILHGEHKKPLNLDVRLNIVVESAQGLAYMHSQTNNVILHGDVKPANILLNDKFAPRISDFGISRLIATDKQHTELVIGDRSYMDPVYLQTGLVTEKSDVYSFGVVILELISRQKATHTDNNSLVKSFIDVHKDRKKATELFDTEIAVEEDLDLLDGLAGIAVDCLNLDVDERPTMTDVVERLVILKHSRKS